MNNTTQNQDEISIMDLAVIIVKRKKSVFLSLLFFTSLSVLYILNYENRYGLTSIVEIGSNSLGDLVESSESVKFKLTQGIIPATLDLFEKQGVKNAAKLSIDVSSPKESTIIILQSKITKATEQQYINFHHTVMSKLIEKHKIIVDNKNSSNDKQSIVDHNGEIILIQRPLLNLSKIQVNAQKSKRAVGLTTFHLTVGGVLISILLSLLSPLFVEFIVQVKLRVDN